MASVVRVYDSETFGSGPVSIEAGGNLTIDSATLNIRAAYANSGTVSGAIQLCEGATLTAGTARFDALTVAEGAVIPVAVGEGFAVEEDVCLVSWASADVEAGTLTVVYDLAVTATLSGPNGAVRFVEGAKVTLVPVALGADAAEGEPLAETEAAASATVTLTGAATPGTVLFKVRVAAP